MSLLNADLELRARKYRTFVFAALAGVALGVPWAIFTVFPLVSIPLVAVAAFASAFCGGSYLAFLTALAVEYLMASALIAGGSLWAARRHHFI